MQTSRILLTATLISSLAACNRNSGGSDASGVFEAQEVVVSSTASGRILALNIEEGDVLPKDSIVGLVDPSGLNLQKEEVQATIESLNEKTMDAGPQVRLLEDQLNVQQSEMDNLLYEKKRTENLVKLDAATGKQLDDINARIDMLKKQMDVTRQQVNVQKNNISTQNRTILSQAKPLQKKAAQIEDMLDKSGILNPVQGTVITKYAEEGEVTGTGKALYKIADLRELTLRAYISGSQLTRVKLGQTVTVRVDQGRDEYKNYSGRVTWISDKAEFTPKTIQTRDERANLVYAVKIVVPNDGYLRIGMYGEVILDK